MRFEERTTTHDFLFNNLLFFVAMFILCFVMINIKKQQSPVTHGEFKITMSWPDESHDDVDLYMKGPDGEIIFFSRKDGRFLHLERDDLGKRNDFVLDPNGGIMPFEGNQEVIIVRGLMPGEYIVNVHLFRRITPGDPENEPYGEEPYEGLIPVKVQLEKLNPYKIITQKTVKLNQQGDEKHIFRFSVNNDGEVSNIIELPIRMVGNKNG